MDNGMDQGRRKCRFSGVHVFMSIIFLCIITVAIIYAFEWLFSYILNYRLFALKEVLINGNSQIDSVDILDAANLHMYIGTRSVYSIMSHVIEKRIKARFRCLEQVKVIRKAVREPGKGTYGLLSINIKERQPIAIAASGENARSFMVVDEHGFALEEIEAGLKSSPPYTDMPVIVGVDDMVLRVNPERNPDQKTTLDLALDVLVNARLVNLYGEIQYINARDPDDIILRLRQRSTSDGASTSGLTHSELSAISNYQTGVMVRIASDRIRDGLSDATPVITKCMGASREMEYEYIDARFPGAVYCKGVDRAEQNNQNNQKAQ